MTDRPSRSLVRHVSASLARKGPAVPEEFHFGASVGGGVWPAICPRSNQRPWRDAVSGDAGSSVIVRDWGFPHVNSIHHPHGGRDSPHCCCDRSDPAAMMEVTSCGVVMATSPARRARSRASTRARPESRSPPSTRPGQIRLRRRRVPPITPPLTSDQGKTGAGSRAFPPRWPATVEGAAAALSSRQIRDAWLHSPTAAPPCSGDVDCPTRDVIRMGLGRRGKSAHGVRLVSGPRAVRSNTPIPTRRGPPPQSYARGQIRLEEMQASQPPVCRGSRLSPVLQVVAVRPITPIVRAAGLQVAWPLTTTLIAIVLGVAAICKEPAEHGPHVQGTLLYI